MIGYIYGLRCPLSNEIRYVGQTRKLKERFSSHKFDLRDNYHKANWIKKLERLNVLDELKMEVLEECTIEELNEKEIYWIKYYKDQGNKLVNCTDGGDTHYTLNPDSIKRMSDKLKDMFLGRKLSEETKKKISERHKGKTLSEEHKKAIKNSLNKFYENNTLKPKTIEQNKKISESLKLYFKEHPQPKKVKQEKLPYVMSEETREKLRKNSLGTNNPFYGKTHTNETKNKISEKNKGILIGEKNPSKRYDVRKKLSDCFKDKIKGKIIMLDDNNNIIKIFISVKELSEFLNLKKYSNSKFPSCLNNQIKYKGFYWKKED
jgi:predicted GIY-YIG superfamily endonuclease